jgi:Fe-S oxidoreductase/nitrate reductase gamma subunit
MTTESSYQKTSTGTTKPTTTLLLKDFVTHVLGQVRIIKKAYPGIMHFLIFWGMTLLTLGHVILLMQMNLFMPFVLNFPKGNTYLVFETISDFAGLALLAGIVLALIRRLFVRPAYLETRWDDYYALAILAIIPVIGYVNEAIRITATNPDWASRSPVGNLFANWFQNLGLTAESATNLHFPFVILHASIGLLFLVSIPFTKLRHLIVTPLNILLRPKRKYGELDTIEDIDNAEILGAGTIEEFESWQLLSFDACLRCGRCEDACPATTVGMKYSPRELIQTLRDTLQQTMVKPTNGNGDTRNLPDIFGDEYCWSCTTCGVCTVICPAFVNPVDQIISLRRYHVLSTGKMPKTVGETLRNMERQGNPWGLPPQEKTKWADGINLPIIDPAQEVDVLLFFGCAMAFDERNKKIARSIVKLLEQLEINFATLDLEEACCGETARRMGHEYLFQVMAEQNIEIFNEFKFKRIVTPCPHCYNTFKNEYPRFGGNFQVQHLSELLHEHLTRLDHQSTNGHKATFHDPCYLGRYNDVFKAPRDLLKSANITTVEMRHHEENSFCCGGGGGQMWMETDPNTRINHKRLEEAVETGADLIVTACPYCLTMFEDAIGAKGYQNQIEVIDLTEALMRERIK